GFSFAVAPLHIGNNPFEWVFASHSVTAIIKIHELDVHIATAEQYHLAMLFSQADKRFIQVKSVMPCKGLQHLVVIKIAFIPSTNRATSQAKFFVGHYLRWINKLLNA